MHYALRTGCVFSNRPEASTKRSEALHPSQETYKQTLKMRRWNYITDSFAVVRQAHQTCVCCTQAFSSKGKPLSRSETCAFKRSVVKSRVDRFDRACRSAGLMKMREKSIRHPREHCCVKHY